MILNIVIFTFASIFILNELLSIYRQLFYNDQGDF